MGYLGEGFVNVPLGDNAAIRLVGWARHDAGYIDNIAFQRTWYGCSLVAPVADCTTDSTPLAENDFNEVDTYGARAALRVELNDSWTITPSVMGQRQYADGVFGYDATLGELEGDQALGKAESQYYDRTILTVSSVDQLLKDQRLKAYIVKAYGLGTDASDDTLRRVLTSDQLDQRSFVNKSNNAAYKALAADFNFNSDGTVARSAVGLAQDKVDVVRTQALYYRQKVEADAGSENEGVRLALYFERKASSITSAYSILADKALLKVAQTALGLPASMSLLDIDRQADLLAKRIDLADFKDPSKVQAFLSTFAAKWEIDNSTATSQSPAALLIGQPTEAFVSVDLLSSLQTLKLGGA